MIAGRDGACQYARAGFTLCAQMIMLPIDSLQTGVRFMKIVKTASAGTLESNDVLVTVEPGEGIRLDIESVVYQQFGQAIRATVMDTLAALDVTDATLHLNDRGALDCTIAARVETAARRAEEGV